MNENKEIPVVNPEKDMISSDDVLAVVSGNQDAIDKQMEKAKELAAAGMDADLVGLPIDQQKRIMDERRKKAEEEAEAARKRAEQLAQEEALRNSPAEKKRLAREAKQKAREEARRAKEEAKRLKKLAKKGNVAVAEAPKTEAVSTELPSPMTSAPVASTPVVTSTANPAPNSTVVPNTTNVTPAPTVSTSTATAVPVTPAPTTAPATPATATVVQPVSSSNVAPVTSTSVTPNVSSATPTPTSTQVTGSPATTTPVAPQSATATSSVASAPASTTPQTPAPNAPTATPVNGDATPPAGDGGKPPKKGGNIKIYLAFIFLALLIWMIVFLPDISSFVQNFFDQKKANEAPAITDGLLVCTLNTNDDTFDYTYEANFEFEDSKMTTLTLVTTTVGDESLDSISLSGLNSSCQLLQSQTDNLDGVEVFCDLSGGTFTNTQELDYKVLQKEALTTAYLEAGGVYPDYEYQQDIDEIEKEMNANNYSCSRYEK